MLISNQGKACLCDFGLSALIIGFHATPFYTSTVGGNVRWAAPEIYRISEDETMRALTVQSDVYSFGCIFLEVLRPSRLHVVPRLTMIMQILSGQVPYYYLVREGQVLLELQAGRKPNRPADGSITDRLWRFINACWADMPNDRPTMQTVSRYIRHQIILEKLPC